MRIRSVTFWLKIATLTAFALLCNRFCHQRTDSFSLLGITSDRPFDARWNTPAPSLEEQSHLEAALAQPYFYLSRGGQAFVFISQDQRYVIKFFKQSLFKAPFWATYLPLPFFLQRYKDKCVWKKVDKLARDFSSYRTAISQLKDYTGLVCVHLNKTSGKLKRLRIFDKLNISHFVDLDKTDFIIQRRAELTYDRIRRFMTSGQQKAAEQTIVAVLNLQLAICQEGFRDRDPNIRTNCGFVDEKPMKIDVGRFVPCATMRDPVFVAEHFARICTPFAKWLAECYPMLLPCLEQTQHQLLNGLP